MPVFPFLHICSVIFVDVGQLPNLYLTPGELWVSQPVSWCKFKSSGDNKHSFGRSKASTQLLMASWESRCTGRCSKITIDDRRLLINSTNFWSGKLWNFEWSSKYSEWQRNLVEPAYIWLKKADVLYGSLYDVAKRFLQVLRTIEIITFKKRIIMIISKDSSLVKKEGILKLMSTRLLGRTRKRFL